MAVQTVFSLPSIPSDILLIIANLAENKHLVCASKRLQIIALRWLQQLNQEMPGVFPPFTEKKIAVFQKAPTLLLNIISKDFKNYAKWLWFDFVDHSDEVATIRARIADKREMDFCHFQRICSNAAGLKYPAITPDKFARITTISLAHFENKSDHFLNPAVSKLVNLNSLDLRRNCYRNLPDSLSKLTLLTQLDLSKNQLLEIPSEVFNLTTLQILNLDVNHLSLFPIALTNLKKLEVLRFEDNHFTTLSPLLKQLPNLKEIHIDKNPYTDTNESRNLKHVDIMVRIRN